ncbi:tripartite tricarboxylate transporter substrate binding protein [Aquabacterium sp. J223]|uniref:tripartite tricarboxylate transporter substrate binding protein n=1 Tax=Aquabacterium sp. J223 TaxID=2898431 RepID=UPI0021ADCEA9|nr:tripartite tricarboxylate transporter substrate binding protein [Aquabacterium sp. J223]UUX97101.1 tripartite tricarboxylate transporter substrate binding protein [Aquabacterium sp. J223]
MTTADRRPRDVRDPCRGVSVPSRRALCAAAAGLVLPLALAAPARADNYPSKPVTLVVAFPPGGMTDIVGRLLANGLTKSLGQTVIVENRAGAAGQLATEYVAGKPGDGYTLLESSVGYVIAPALQKKIRYDPAKDFAPIALLATTPNLLVVNPSVPARTVAEFIAWAKAQPSVPFSTSGAGGATHLTGELLRHLSGAPLNHVPYKGAAPAAQAVLAGEVPVSVLDAVSGAALVASGKLRALAVTTAQRSALFPNLPTLAESGFRDFDSYTWLGLYAPAGTPQAVVDRLNRDINQILRSPEVAARLREQNAEAGGAMTPAQFRKHVDSELVKWQRTVQVTGVKVDE